MPSVTVRLSADKPPSQSPIIRTGRKTRRRKFTYDTSPLDGCASRAGRLHFSMVCRTAEEGFRDRLIEAYHYLGKNLASRILATNVRRLPHDWQAFNNQRLVLLETFVDTTGYAGTCYKAANWHHAGLTRSRS